MKQYYIPATFLFLSLTGCATSSISSGNNENTSTSTKIFGAPITAEGAIGASLLPTLIDGHDSIQTKMVAKVLSVCQAKGCFMHVEIPGQDPMQVKFKEYAFFAPKDLAGKQVVVEGIAKRELVAVEKLKHYALDAGKSQQEIDAITQPRVILSFMASSLMVK